MNKEILITVIERALVIEDMLSQIFRTLLEIEKPNSKTLSHKTSALSFMTKVDLLFDLERIDLYSYNLLKMFGEIRNQFIHNIDSDSFSIVLERLNKNSKLLKIDTEFPNYFKDAIDSNQQERIYDLAFQKLALDIHDILETVRKKIFEEKLDNINSALKAIEKEKLEKFMTLVYESIDEFSDIFSQKMKDLTGIDYGDYISKGIVSILNKKIESIK
ncbi:MAG TPA: hypothetical protein VFG54_00795 [Prolixibacteraceae bacterium]|nr:hypothetical protein [Prolixibacteraceae bacterium]